MENRKYKVVISQSGKLDVKEKKKYILQQFKYREYAENFCKKIKLSRGLEPPTSALPRRRATDCAKTAYRVWFHTQKLIYTSTYKIVKKKMQ